MDYSFDARSDTSHKELYSYLSGVTLPTYVAEANLSFEKTAEDIYADGVGQFPVSTPEDTFISNAFFLNKKAEILAKKGPHYVARVEKELEKSASLFGILEDVATYEKQISEKSKVASDDRTISISLSEGDNIDLFHLKSASDVTSEANRFSKNIDKYPFQWRRKIAQEFTDAADHFGVEELPDNLLKYAGFYFADLNDVTEEIDRRKRKLANIVDSAAYEKLHDMLEDSATQDDIFKIAEACDELEKQAQYRLSYQTKQVLGDPIDHFFTMSIEKVANIVDVVQLGDERFKKADLAQVPPEVYEQAFGYPIDLEDPELYDVGPTLPKSDVSLFKEMTHVNPV